MTARLVNTIRIAFLCALLGAAGTSSSAVTWSEDLARELGDKVVSLAEEHNIVGVAVGVVVDHEHLFTVGAGLANLGAPKSIQSNTVFHWASVSKPFVAVAVMQLVERGQLTLDDQLVDHLPYFEMADARYRVITLRQLLNHTSGMPDVDDYEWDRPQHDPGALKRWALQQKDRTLLFAPGESRQYSNIGFELLGLVVQEASGMHFEDYMSDNILKPLGMSDSSFIAEDIDADLRVIGHSGKTERHAVDAYPYNRRHAPSSTLNSNVRDMARFAIALLNDGTIDDVSLLSPASIAAMWRPSWVSPDDPERMSGLGWNLGRPWGEIFSASHGGHDDGFRSFLYLAPEEGVAVFLASNDETISTGLFVRSILEILFPEKAAK